MPENDLRERLLTLFQQPGYRPLDKSELARSLEIDPKERAALREALRSLASEGRIVQLKKARYALPRADSGSLAGRFRFSGHRGNGEVEPDDGHLLPGGFRTVFIPGRAAMTALEGDRVMVRLEKRRQPHWLKELPAHVRQSITERLEETTSGPVGRVIQVLERSDRPVVGTLHRVRQFVTVLPDERAYPEQITIEPGHDLDARAGDKVLVRVTGWDMRTQPPRGRVVQILGPTGDPGVDIVSLIHRYGLRQVFPDAALREAEAVPPEVTAAEREGREDWRTREVITIDPFDARDFDDAIAVTELPGGGWELAVHIADVSHYVQPDTALDKEARLRGNSVYLVDRVLPMLPEALSNGICSLKPDVDRLTRAVIMEFDAKGKRRSVRFVSAVIRSARRFTYEEAYALLQAPEETAAADPQAAVLRRAWKLAAQLRSERFRAGALDLDFPEIKVVLDERGKPVELRKVEYDESHQLIEEFMLAANEAVAEATRRADRPSVYRVHEDPDADKLFEFRELARLYGYTPGDLTHRPELQRLLQAVKGTPEEHAVKIGLLKSLKRARYAADALGHFGLAKANYTHFTSPIRRYADLIVHRVLRRLAPGGEEAPRTPGYGVLGDTSDHISATERNAADAEQVSKRMKIAEYFSVILAEDPERTFPAVVVDINPRGLMVELTDLFIKGLVKVEDLPPDEYRLEAAMGRFAGHRPENRFGLGHALTVRVARVDMERHFIDFRVASGDPRGESELQNRLPLPARRKRKTGRAPNGSRSKRPPSRRARRKG